MELKRLISHFTYRIEPKPEGGFIAHASDPTVPPLEATTREELQQKIQANIGAALAAEFPGLKLPLENKELKFSFHVEHKPGGGFIIQSTDGKGAPIEGATHAEIESHFAEKVVGLLGKHLMPELSRALAGQLASGDIGSGDVKVFVNRKVSFPAGTPALTLAAAGSIQAESAKSTATVNPADSSPIVPDPIIPERSSGGTILRFVLALAIISVLMFLFLRR
jgi:hypothetical protein